VGKTRVSECWTVSAANHRLSADVQADTAYATISNLIPSNLEILLQWLKMGCLLQHTVVPSASRETTAIQLCMDLEALEQQLHVRCGAWYCATWSNDCCEALSKSPSHSHA
jgi:hypothetical protein